MSSLHHITAMPKHPDPMFHTDADYQQSVERAKRDCIRQRLAAGADPETGILKPSRVLTMPLSTSRLPLSTRVDAAEYVDEGVERFGRAAVVRALCAVLAANNIDVVGRTLDELAQGSEEQ
jgi:hypothetical protein